jgi:general secretion pathway protein C
MQMRKNWTIRLATFAVWLLAGASLVFWVLKFIQGTAVPANAAVVAAPASAVVDATALSRGLGGSSQTPVGTVAVAPPSSINAARFVLTGVVAGQFPGQGIALIAVDGKGAKPYKVGTSVTQGVVLQSVRARQAKLATTADAPEALTLELPLLASAIVGTAQPVVPLPVQAPQVVPVAAAPPTVLPSIVSTPPLPGAMATGAMDATASALGGTPQMAVRPGATRQRAGKEVMREDGSTQTVAPATQ